MLAAIAQQMSETGQAAPADPAAMAKVILDSLALRYASVLRTIEVAHRPHDRRRAHRRRRQPERLPEPGDRGRHRPAGAWPGRSKRPSIGNVLVQAITAGRFASLADARRHVAERIQPRRFEPRPAPGWADVARRYADLEARYLDAR